MQAVVGTKEDVRKCREAALALARDLSIIWAYVAGVPLFPKTLIIRLVKSPTGWSTNTERVYRALPATKLHGEIRLGQRRPYLVTMPHMPLKLALEAVARYRVADEVSRTLIQLHFDAMGNLGTEAALFLSAKALEICRALLPGRNDNLKQKALRREVTNELRHSLHWLFGIANQRREVRHVVRDTSSALLHPKLTAEERRDFDHDSDLVIRGVIADRLGLEPAIVKEKPP